MGCFRVHLGGGGPKARAVAVLESWGAVIRVVQDCKDGFSLCAAHSVECTVGSSAVGTAYGQAMCARKGVAASRDCQGA